MPDRSVVRKTVLEAVFALLPYSMANMAAMEAVGMAERTTMTPSTISSVTNGLKISHVTTGITISFTSVKG